MSGPVWRFEKGTEATCAICFRTITGVFVEGVIVDNVMRPGRRVCPDCYQRSHAMLVRGELGRFAEAPAYAHR